MKETKVLTLKIKILAHAEGMSLPAYATPGSSGLDLRAAIQQPVYLERGSRMLVPTGLCLEVPAGYEAQIRPRSGLALNHGVTVLNSPGTIDSDYRGEVKMRIAQMVLSPVVRAQVCAVTEFTTGASKRGEDGFGSTGWE